MKVIGSMIRSQDMVNFIGVMERFMMETGSMMKSQVMAKFIIKMETFTKGTA